MFVDCELIFCQGGKYNCSIVVAVVHESEPRRIFALASHYFCNSDTAEVDEDVHFTPSEVLAVYAKEIGRPSVDALFQTVDVL